VSVASAIDAARVTAWLTDRLPELEPPLVFERVGEGQSNLTFRVADGAGRTVVLRRPPLGEILASAHDVAREYRILTALRPADVPVPATLGLCEDLAVTGAPFYAMEHVDGLVVTRQATAERLAPAARATAGHSLAATLAQLHRVDLDVIGLGGLRRRESLAARQLRRWKGQWAASKTRNLPAIDEVADYLAARMPEERETVLLHGDYHLHNLVLGEDGSVRAILDWELCTAGDPLADVGQMLAYWRELRDRDGLFREPVAALDGFPDDSRLAQSYAKASGRDVDDIGYWVAFAYWKIAIIVEGVYRRWLNNPENGAAAGTLGPAVERLANLARDATQPARGGEPLTAAGSGTLKSNQPWSDRGSRGRTGEGRSHGTGQSRPS
jgi:aminoglycoside phosphotransferase (APT) family kinase protein